MSNPLQKAFAIARPDGSLLFDIGPSEEMAWRAAWLGTCNGPDWDACAEYRRNLEAEGFKAVPVSISLKVEPPS